DGVIVDSHFTQRLRLPRLLAAARAHPGQVGVGINERAVVEFADGQVRILSGSAQFLRVTGPGPGDYLSFDMIRGETYTIPDGTRVGPAAATSASPLLAAAQTQVRDVLAPFAASQALNDEAAVRAAF
ncbi:MAG TPA: hypothetical protein VNI01_04970, partial [Elusimicrobiota bacterium]|nr:hypothetical protein [Elusimicrobiota bacterium]